MVANKDYICEDDEVAESAYHEYEKLQGHDPAGEERLWENADVIKERVLNVLH